MEDELHKRVIGQEDAIKAVSQAIRRTRAGLKDPKRPSGSFIFLGLRRRQDRAGQDPRRVPLRRRPGDDQPDMSEYMEKHAVTAWWARLPGYVGYEEGGQLTEPSAASRSRSSLRRDREGAPDVFNTLLQILEEGRLTDSPGPGRSTSATPC